MIEAVPCPAAPALTAARVGLRGELLGVIAILRVPSLACYSDCDTSCATEHSYTHVEMRPGLHAAAMSDASLSSREPLLSQLATSDDALRRAHNARPGSPRTEKDDQGPYSGNTSPTYTGSAPWTPVEARNSSLAASRRPSWWPSSARAAGYARPGSPLTSRLPSRASFRLLLSSKRTLALLAAVVLLALLGSASSQASSSATSEPHYRLPVSRFNPATWRAPFSFSWGDSRTGSATCTPHAPEDLAERFDRASRPLDVKATTSQRLDDWEFEAPGWGVEPADWVRRNVQVCLPGQVCAGRGGLGR